jgi:hypothetical protein
VDAIMESNETAQRVEMTYPFNHKLFTCYFEMDMFLGTDIHVTAIYKHELSFQNLRMLLCTLLNQGNSLSYEQNGVTI